MDIYLYQGEITCQMSDCKELLLNKLEFVTLNLEVVIQTHSLRIDQITSILYQVLCGLKYVHSTHVIHRDSKPANILVNPPTGEVKICDFSLSSGLCHDRPLTANVSTLWFRAPEVILNPRNYGKPSE